MDDPEPSYYLSSFSDLIQFQEFQIEILLGLVACLVLIVCSALVSGAEVAYFSLNHSQIHAFRKSKGNREKSLTNLLDQPNELLATILISNNLINIGIIILSSFIIDQTIVFGNIGLEFAVKVGLVTIVLLILGEITPKVYATKKNADLALFMVYPLVFLRFSLKPLAALLTRSISLLSGDLKPKEQMLSGDELTHAVDITIEEEDEHRILSGIVQFGNTDVKQIMCPRMDMTAIEYNLTYQEVLKFVSESGFSRIPVYRDTADQIEGVIYVKDFLPHLKSGEEPNWHNLIRKAQFVPETKKIDDLLREFQQNKAHLAVVVDEYGGTSGIVTLEDILEEIVGDINDEFDETIENFKKESDGTMVVDGKMPLVDFYKILDTNGEQFEEVKGESDTVAGFVIELAGKIPKKYEKIRFNNFLFTIDAANIKRVKSVRVKELEETDE